MDKGILLDMQPQPHLREPGQNLWDSKFTKTIDGSGCHQYDIRFNWFHPILSPHLALVGISLPIDPTMWLVLSEQFTLFENLNIQAEWNLHCAHRLPLRGLVDECIPAAFLIMNIFLLSSSDFPHHLVALEGRRIVFPILVKDWALYTCAQLIAPKTNWSWR